MKTKPKAKTFRQQLLDPKANVPPCKNCRKPVRNSRTPNAILDRTKI